MVSFSNQYLWILRCISINPGRVPRDENFNRGGQPRSSGNFTNQITLVGKCLSGGHWWSERFSHIMLFTVRSCVLWLSDAGDEWLSIHPHRTKNLRHFHHSHHFHDDAFRSHGNWPCFIPRSDHRTGKTIFPGKSENCPLPDSGAEVEPLVSLKLEQIYDITHWGSFRHSVNRFKYLTSSWWFLVPHSIPHLLLPNPRHRKQINFWQNWHFASFNDRLVFVFRCPVFFMVFYNFLYWV